MLDTFRPLIDAAHGLDLDDPARALATLERRFDPQGADAQRLNQELIALFEAGKIAERGAPPVKWGRVTKAVPESREQSIDVVWMEGKGPRHVHPRGEVNWLIPLTGEPRFEDTRSGWVVMKPSSQHVPEVQGGTMLIVYLLPGGAIEFEPQPDAAKSERPKS